MEYKGYMVAGDGVYGYKKIAPIGKGSVPAELRGIFTTSSFAQKAIDAYVDNKKEVKNGKDISAS